jgi:hypothetical protein
METGFHPMSKENAQEQVGGASRIEDGMHAQRINIPLLREQERARALKESRRIKEQERVKQTLLRRAALDRAVKEKEIAQGPSKQDYTISNMNETQVELQDEKRVEQLQSENQYKIPTTTQIENKNQDAPRPEDSPSLFATVYDYAWNIGCAVSSILLVQLIADFSHNIYLWRSNHAERNVDRISNHKNIQNTKVIPQNPTEFNIFY